MANTELAGIAGDSTDKILGDMGSVIYCGSYWATYALKSFPDEEIQEVASQCRSRHEMEIVEEEARSLIALHHPNVAACKQAFVHNSLLYYRIKRYSRSLEYELRQTLREGRLMSEERILQVAHQVTQGLAYLHDPGRRDNAGRPLPAIVHGDVCPSNILINEEDQFVLANCGVWRSDLLGRVPARSRPYIAPEVLLGKAHSCAADMWSLGAVLYELATGKSVVSCNYPGASHVWADNGPADLSEVSSNRIRRVLNCLLQLDPGERATARELDGIIGELKICTGDRIMVVRILDISKTRDMPNHIGAEHPTSTARLLLSNGARALVDAVCEGGLDSTGVCLKQQHERRDDATVHSARLDGNHLPKM